MQTVREYDAFGNLLSESAPAFDLPIGYAGGLDDRVTGLVRFGFRDLDTASGRWTARDPALYDGGQANLYTYVGGDPVVAAATRSGCGAWAARYYQGVGGGAQVCHTDEGWAVCVEVGIGFGWAVGLDNQSKLPEDGERDRRRGEGQHRRLRCRHRRRVNDCGKVSSTGSIDLLALNVNVGDGTLQAPAAVDGAGAQIKVAAKMCRRIGG